MRSERGKQIVLGALIIALGALMYRAWSLSAPDGSAGASPSRAPVAADRAARDTLAVRLDALKAEWPAPAETRRNLFRFGEASSSAVRSAPPPSSVQRPAAQPAPIRPPSIGLKLIGIVESSGPAGRVAVLGDDRGVYHGHEGDIIEGRYRILRIAADSVEVSRLDAGTQQVLRLSETGIP